MKALKFPAYCRRAARMNQEQLIDIAWFAAQGERAAKNQGFHFYQGPLQPIEINSPQEMREHIQRMLFAVSVIPREFILARERAIKISTYLYRSVSI